MNSAATRTLSPPIVVMSHVAEKLADTACKVTRSVDAHHASDTTRSAGHRGSSDVIDGVESILASKVGGASASGASAPMGWT